MIKIFWYLFFKKSQNLITFVTGIVTRGSVTSTSSDDDQKSNFRFFKTHQYLLHLARSSSSCKYTKTTIVNIDFLQHKTDVYTYLLKSSTRDKNIGLSSLWSGINHSLFFKSQTMGFNTDICDKVWVINCNRSVLFYVHSGFLHQ